MTRLYYADLHWHAGLDSVGSGTALDGLRLCPEDVDVAVGDLAEHGQPRLVHGVMVWGRKSVGQAGRPAFIVLLGRYSRTFHPMERGSISGVQWN